MWKFARSTFPCTCNTSRLSGYCTHNWPTLNRTLRIAKWRYHIIQVDTPLIHALSGNRGMPLPMVRFSRASDRRTRPPSPRLSVQMFMQPPQAGMRMQMAPQQIQGFSPQGMPIMGQPGAPAGPPGSPFYHSHMQVNSYRLLRYTVLFFIFWLSRRV